MPGITKKTTLEGLRNRKSYLRLDQCASMYGNQTLAEAKQLQNLHKLLTNQHLIWPANSSPDTKRRTLDNLRYRPSRCHLPRQIQEEWEHWTTIKIPTIGTPDQGPFSVSWEPNNSWGTRCGRILIFRQNTRVGCHSICQMDPITIQSRVDAFNLVSRSTHGHVRDRVCVKSQSSRQSQRKRHRFYPRNSRLQRNIALRLFKLRSQITTRWQDTGTHKRKS